MNERIFDMARQSGATDEQGSRAEHIFCFTNSELSALTELIVKECLVQIDGAIPDTNCSAAGAYKTAKLAATSRVKNHFGVWS